MFRSILKNELKQKLRIKSYRKVDPSSYLTCQIYNSFQVHIRRTILVDPNKPLIYDYPIKTKQNHIILSFQSWGFIGFRCIYIRLCFTLVTSRTTKNDSNIPIKQLKISKWSFKYIFFIFRQLKYTVAYTDLTIDWGINSCDTMDTIFQHNFFLIVIYLNIKTIMMET